jgi:hypothetical protein
MAAKLNVEHDEFLILVLEFWKQAMSELKKTATVPLKDMW